MVTFSSGWPPGRKTGKRRKKVKNKNKGVVQRKGKYLQNTVKKKKIRIKPTRWSDLNAKQKIINTVVGKGKNSGNWKDIPPKVKPVKTKITKPVKVKTKIRPISKDKDNLPYDKDGFTLPTPPTITENPDFDIAYEEKQKVKSEQSIAKIQEAVDEVTDETGIVPADAVVETGDEEIDNFVNNKIQTHYNPSDPESEFEAKRAQTPLDPVEIKSIGVEIANSDSLKTIGDFDIDTDMLTIDEISEKDDDLAFEISNKKINLTPKYIEDEDGNITAGDAKIIGIIPSKSSVSEQIIGVKTNDYNKVIPGNGDTPPRFAEKLQPKAFENYINQDAKIVAAYPDGEVKILPYEGSINMLPEIEVVGEDPIDVGNIFKRELYFDNLAGIDDFYNPDDRSFYQTDEDFENRENFDQYADSAFDSAVDNFPCEDLLDPMFMMDDNENGGFNGSKYKARGFYFNAKEGRIYSNVLFDQNGRPVTADPTIFDKAIYTGSVMNTDGEPADYINLFKFSPELSHLVENIPFWAGNTAQFIKNGLNLLDNLLTADCDEVKDFLKNGKKEYNKDFDKDPAEKLQDLQRRANDIVAEVDTLLGELKDNKIRENFIDNTAKLEVINSTWENNIFPKVSELVELRDDLDDKKSQENLSEKEKENINILVDEYNLKVKEYKSLLKELTNTPLKDLQSQFFPNSRNPQSSSTIVKGSGFSMNFPASQVDPTQAALILQEKNQDLTIAEIAEQNQDLQAQQALQFFEYNEKSNYANTLLDDLEVQTESAFRDYLEDLKNKALQGEVDTTLAQNIALLTNRVSSNLIRIIPGIANIILLIDEAVMRVIQGDDTEGTAKDLADLAHELNIAISEGTEKVVDELKIKPGLEERDFDKAEAQMMNNTYWQGALLIIDVAMDIAGSKGLGVISGLSKTRRITTAAGKIKKISRMPSNKAISRSAIPWKKKLKLYLAKNVPVMLPRIVSERTEEVNNLMKSKGVDISPSQRLSLVLLTSLIESTLDKFGLDMLGAKASPKLVTFLTNKLANKLPGETVEKALSREVKALIAAQAITMVGGTAFNIADEVVQESTTMFIQNTVDGQLDALGKEILYNNPELFSASYWDEMQKVAIVAAIGIGTVNLAMNVSSSVSTHKQVSDLIDETIENFRNYQYLRPKEGYRIALQQLQAEKLREEKAIEDLNVSAEEKAKMKQALADRFNTTKSNLKFLHESLQKVDFELNDQDGQAQWSLEREKMLLLEKLEQDNLGVVESQKIKDRISEIDNALGIIKDRTTDDEGNILDNAKQDIALEFDEEAEAFLSRIEEDDDFNVFETIDEAEEYARSIGTTMGGNPAKYYIDKEGVKHFIFSKEGAIRKGKLDFEHEGDHDLVNKLEEEFGAEITSKMADALRRAFVNGDIKFKNEKDQKAFEDLMARYEKLDPNDKNMLDDEFIVNLRDAIREGKVDVDTKNDLVSIVEDEVEGATGEIITLDLSNDTDLLNLLDLMAEDADLAIAIVEQSGVVTPVEERVEEELEPVERFALNDNEAEKKELIEENKKLVSEDRVKNASKIQKNIERIKILNKGIQNAEDVATIEDPNSGPGAIQRAENRLDANNKEAIVQSVVNQKMTGDTFMGTVTLDDGTELKAAVPRSEIEELLRSKEYPDIYAAYFRRGPEFKDMPIGLKIKNDLLKRWQQTVDPLVKKYAREQRDREEGTSLFDGEVETNINEITPKEIIKTNMPENMRTALGIFEGSPIYDKIISDVISTFGTKLPSVESGKLKKALQDAFATKIEPLLRSMIEEMGIESFIDTYGKEIYDAFDQSIMNKSFQDFTRKGPRLSPTETRRAMEDGRIPNKKDINVNDGVYLFEKEPYNPKKFKAAILDPKSIGLKGTKYSKITGLVQSIAKQLGLDATPTVLQDDEVISKYNDINKLMSQVEATAEQVANEISKDPKSRFSLVDEAGKLLFEPSMVKQMIIQAAGRTLRNGGNLDAWDVEAASLPMEVVEIAEELGIRDLFNSEISAYKAQLKDDLAKDKLPAKYESEIDSYFENLTKKNDLEVAMKEMDDFNQAITDKLPARVIKALGGPLFFHYDYSYLDGGEKGGKGSGVFGPWKESADNIKEKQNGNVDEELDFEPNDVEILNSRFGILKRIETILDKDSETVEEKYRKIGLNADGSVKPNSLLDKLQKANQANKKALNYVMIKAAEAISVDPSLIPGFLRSLEATTNNTKSYRGLTSLKALEIYAESQAAFYNPETNQYASSLTAAQKNDPNWMINYAHPNYAAAEELALEEMSKLGIKNSDADFQIEFEKKIAKHLNYKGEHIDAAANVMAELANNVLDAASKLSESKSDDEYNGIIESLKAKNDLTLTTYDQIHGTEVASAVVDEMAGTTNPSKYVRATQAFDTDNMLNIDDPSVSAKESIEESIIQDEAIENIIEDRLKVKTKNRNSLKKSNVVQLEGDLTGPEVLAKMKTLDAVLNLGRSDKPMKVKKARVFDFDDTLAKTNSKVFYTLPNGEKGVLTAEEFALQGADIKAKGGEFDFTDFNRVVDPEEGPMLPLLKKMYEAEGERDFFILTARAPESAPAIHAWLQSEGINIPLENVIGLGNSSEQAKAEWFCGAYVDGGYNDFFFGDDVDANTGAVADVLSVIDVKSKVQQAKARFALKGEEIANKIYKMVAAKNKKLSTDALKNISEVKASIKGREIKDPFFQSSSTQNFTGLLYKFLGKGEQGNKDWQMLQDNLVKPYTRGLNDLANIKNTLLADFNEVLSNFVGAGKPIKDLNEDVPGLGGYTYEDAVRILAWDSQGIKADGVPPTTLKKLKSLANKDKAIQSMADQLVNINKGDGYYYPGEDWRAGTLTTDLMQGISNVKRPKVLAEWNENIETIFGKDTGKKFDGQLMNAIEATYGKAYREAFEDMLRRMKSGRNRRVGNSKLENRFFDWLNNSVGAVMFFNMRSGLLQTLSSVNYLNWSFNNPAAAAKAFANQPQYWKDYLYLFNSDFLVDRRGGNKINISEAEVFDAVNNQSNKAKAFLNLLIKKGFSITQAADSFAIASGGATYYRNRINNLMKKGMSEKDAEAQAYEEWTSLSREAQQSSDAIEISSQQAGGLGRVILAFGNTPMQYNRIIWKGIQDIKDGRGDLKTNLSRIAYYSTLQNLMFNALQQALFAGLNDPEEEWDERKYEVIDGMLNSLMRGMGVSGSIMAAIKDVGLDIYDRTKKPRPEYYKAVFQALNVAPPLDVKVSKFVRGANTYEYNRKNPKMKEYFNIENPSYQAAALVVASTTNIPVDRLLQKMTNIKDAFDQDRENWQRVMLLMGWSDWQLEDSEQKKKREQEESDLKHYYNALENPSLYNKNEQIDILRQHGISDEKINAMKKQDDRVKAIIDAENKSGKQFTSKIPNVKISEKVNSNEAFEEVRVANFLKNPANLPSINDEEEAQTPVMLQDVEPQSTSNIDVENQPKSVNFTENTSFKNNRVPIEKRNKEELKLYEMPADKQRDSLKSLGLSESEIKALKYEGDRVRKILELQN